MPADVPIRYVGRNAAVTHLWQKPGSTPALWPLHVLSGVYRGVVRARRSAYQRGLARAARVSVPVISVGNLVVGGAGKTPISKWVIDQLLERGQRPALLHGGYAADEPQLHRVWHPDVPVYSGKDRVANAERAIRAGATVIVLDDAFQHLRLARDLDIVLVSADHWFWPKRLLPAGPWREPLSILQQADVVIVTRKAAPHDVAVRIGAEVQARWPDLPVAVAQLDIDPRNAHRARVIAVSSIADPTVFADQLVQHGVALDELIAYDDHHDYTQDDVAFIRELAAGRPVLTTEKDAVKLRALEPSLDLHAVGQQVVIESGNAALEKALNEALRA